MDIKPEYPCKCGHDASFHQAEWDDHNIDIVSAYNGKNVKLPLKVVRDLQRCTYDKSLASKPDNDPNSWTGVSYDYTNFGRHCPCDGFKLDNLRFLEQKSK